MTTGPADEGAQGTAPVPLDPVERRRAAERTAPGPRVVHEAIRQEGEEELSRPSSALFWSGLAAGLSMGFSLVGQATLEQALPATPWAHTVASFGYTLGFLFVVLGRQQLFTETTLTALLPMLSPGPRRAGDVARVWGVVLVANLLGALLFAVALSFGPLFDPQARAAFFAIGHHALAPGPLGIGVRAVFGGWLIALMVWLMPASGGSRFAVILSVTWLVAAAQLSHVIAGSVDVLFLVVNGEASPWQYLGGFLLPALVGNSIGGVALVAALNHAQVAAGRT